MESRQIKETLKSYTKNGAIAGSGVGFCLGFTTGAVFDVIRPAVVPYFSKDPRAIVPRLSLLGYAKGGAVGMIPGAAVGAAVGGSAGLVKIGVLAGLCYFRIQQKSKDINDSQLISDGLKNNNFKK